MDLPVVPPLRPMLAKLQPEMPRGPGWRYEPKWDGFRAIVWRDGNEMEITSRDTRPFVRYFPELVEPLATALPPRCVVDGEIVVAGRGGLEFDSLQLRIHPAASRIGKLAQEIPASFIAFDVVALGDRSLISSPLSERRSLLEAALGSSSQDAASGLAGASGATQIMVTPQTEDADEAAVWFDAFEPLGLDGLIAKHSDLTYRPGDRAMVKIKHKRTADCVVGGYRLSKAGDGVGSLLLGLYDGPHLHYVGHTSGFKAAERRELLARLRALEAPGSFAGGRTPGGPSRWTGGKDPEWFPVRPELVCEVTYDHMQGPRFRHAAGFVAWRPDKAPRECTFDQVL